MIRKSLNIVERSAHGRVKLGNGSKTYRNGPSKSPILKTKKWEKSVQNDAFKRVKCFAFKKHNPI